MFTVAILFNERNPARLSLVTAIASVKVGAEPSQSSSAKSVAGGWRQVTTVS